MIYSWVSLQEEIWSDCAILSGCTACCAVQVSGSSVVSSVGGYGGGTEGASVAQVNVSEGSDIGVEGAEGSEVAGEAEGA